jgi:hypothetical protein
MRRTWLALLPLVCSLSLSTPSSIANESSFIPPDPAIYQVEEVTFTGLSIFDGSTYVANSWLKIKVAIPKQVNCKMFESVYFGNCTAKIRSSAESSVSLNPTSRYFTEDFYIFVDIPNEDRQKFTVYPAIEKLKPIGTVWKDYDLRFFSKQSQSVSIKLDYDYFVSTQITKKEILVKTLVKTQAEVDAENAAIRAAAEAAAAKEQAAAAVAAAQEQEAQRAKKLTITCAKGNQRKKVTGENPKCPVGFKNPLGSFATFQAFSTCKLYKKDAYVGGAQLKDGGRTLILDAVKERSYRVNALIDADYKCVASVMKMPAFVASKVESTRAIDGMQNAQWGKVSAFWNFHPDNGLDITFNSK